MCVCAGASPDYLFLLQRLLMDNPDAAVNLAKMVAKQVGSRSYAELHYWVHL
mgnify:CR=1 FL=1